MEIHYKKTQVISKCGNHLSLELPNGSLMDMAFNYFTMPSNLHTLCGSNGKITEYQLRNRRKQSWPVLRYCHRI
jgi:hypothetical protein